VVFWLVFPFVDHHHGVSEKCNNSYKFPFESILFNPLFKIFYPRALFTVLPPINGDYGDDQLSAAALNRLC